MDSSHGCEQKILCGHLDCSGLLTCPIPVGLESWFTVAAQSRNCTEVSLKCSASRELPYPNGHLSPCSACVTACCKPRVILLKEVLLWAGGPLRFASWAPLALRRHDALPLIGGGERQKPLKKAMEPTAPSPSLNQILMSVRFDVKARRLGHISLPVCPERRA